MPELMRTDFEQILSNPSLGFDANVTAILEHQTPLTGQGAHQDCAGFYYTKPQRELIKPYDVSLDHGDGPVRHIAEQDRDKLGLYITARDDPTPKRADVEQLAALHETSPYCIRAFVTHHAVFGSQYFFMRGDRRAGIRTGILRDWSDDLPLVERLRFLQAADVAFYIKGLITTGVAYTCHTKHQLYI